VFGEFFRQGNGHVSLRGPGRTRSTWLEF
jgi:hypothetical protein